MIARSTCLGLAMNLLCITGIPTAADAGEREDVLSYLKKNIIGRTLEHQSTSKISEGKIETEFTRRTSFTNLVETSSGLAFDEIIVVKQVLYDLDGLGKRVAPGRQKDRVVVMRHEYAVRESTNHVLGIARVLTNTIANSTGVANSERITINGDSLVIHQSDVGYGDFYAPGGKYEPANSDSREEFSVGEGKLRRVTTRVSYNVDPETLNRRERRRDVPDLIDTELPPSKPD